MEDIKAYSSSNEQIAYSPSLRPRAVPDVPEDVDLIMEHLNDPNYDLKKAYSSSDIELANRKMKYSQSDFDADSRFESDRYSTSRAESRNSTAIEFDESVCIHCLTVSQPLYSESPYPEVRAAVSSVDDPSMPVNTFRMFVLCLASSVDSHCDAGGFWASYFQFWFLA